MLRGRDLSAHGIERRLVKLGPLKLAKALCNSDPHPAGYEYSIFAALHMHGVIAYHIELGKAWMKDARIRRKGEER